MATLEFVIFREKKGVALMIPKSTISTVKHGGGSIMSNHMGLLIFKWALHVIVGKKKLNLVRRWGFYQDNNPKGEVACMI